MRRSVLLLVSMALAVLVASGVALAVTKNCRAGADFCTGTNERDRLIGSKEQDKMYGKGGNDTLRGNRGNDSLRGNSGDDTLEGGEGEDSHHGGKGTDKLYGGSQSDRLDDGSYEFNQQSELVLDRNLLSGGGGNDYLYGGTRLVGGPGDDNIRGAYAYGAAPETKRTFKGGPGQDRIVSHSGTNDTIYARDNEKDVVNCGGGKDTVYFDRGLDSINPNCENRNPE